MEGGRLGGPGTHWEALSPRRDRPYHPFQKAKAAAARNPAPKKSSPKAAHRFRSPAFSLEIGTPKSHEARSTRVNRFGKRNRRKATARPPRPATASERGTKPS